LWVALNAAFWCLAPIRRVVLAIALVSGTVSPGVGEELSSPPASAEGLTREEKSAFIDALARDDVVTIRAIAVAAIVRDSARTTGIVRDIFELAPEQAVGIVNHLAETFPPLADRLTALSEEIRRESPGLGASEDAPSDAIAAGTAAKPEDAVSPWSGETSIGGSFRSAVQSSLTASAELKVEHEVEPWKNSAVLKFDYGQTNDVANDQRFLAEGRSQRELDERHYGYGFTSYEDDRFSGFDYQITEGVGLGYQLFDTEAFDLSFEGGPSLRQSETTATGEVNNEVLLRLGAILEWNISDSAVFSNRTELFFSRSTVEVTSSSDAGIEEGAESTNVSALDLQIVANLAARFSYEFHYRSDPPPNGPESETTAKMSLVHRY
jgi:putative salt-induced outer membrane protein